MAASSNWKPVFRILPGVGGVKAMDFWAAGFTEDFGSDPLLFPAAHYKSPLVDQWETLGVELVKVSLYSYRQGNEVRELIFDGKGTNKLNWFSQENLISSPWTDLKKEKSLFNFSIMYGQEGSDNTEWPRGFYIAKHQGGIVGREKEDTGWLVVVEGGTTKWENRDQRVPHILFSKKSTFVNWTSEVDDVGTADIMVVSIKTSGHVKEASD